LDPLSGERSLYAEGANSHPPVAPNSFAYELDDLLALVDIAVREANKNTRPAAYQARLMKLRTFPAGRESVRAHVIRAAALAEAAVARRALLEQIELLHEAINTTLEADPDMEARCKALVTSTDAEGADTFEQSEFALQTALRSHARNAFGDAAKKFHVVADCFKNVEGQDLGEDFTKFAHPVSAPKKVEKQPVYNFDEEAPAFQGEEDDEPVLRATIPHFTTVNEVISEGGIEVETEPSKVIAERGWFQWDATCRMQLYETFKAGYAWISAGTASTTINLHPTCKQKTK
jgi:hypothetical protein